MDRTRARCRRGGAHACCHWLPTIHSVPMSSCGDLVGYRSGVGYAALPRDDERHKRISAVIVVGAAALRSRALVGRERAPRASSVLALMSQAVTFRRIPRHHALAMYKRKQT